MFSKLFLAVLMLFALSSCKQPDSYTYFMSHPAYLKKELLRCRDTELGACAVINKAGRDFSDLIEERGQDPQAFGEKILRLQEQLAGVKLAFSELKKNLPVDEKALSAKRQALHLLCHQLRVMYAVVVETTGELG